MLLVVMDTILSSYKSDRKSLLVSHICYIVRSVYKVHRTSIVSTSSYCQFQNLIFYHFFGPCFLTYSDSGAVKQPWAVARDRSIIFAH